MKKLYTLIVMAFIAVAVNAQIANKKVAISPLNDISVKGNRSLSNIRIPENAVKVTPLKKAPKKAISSVSDLAGEYEWTYYTTEEDPAADPSTIENYSTVSADVKFVVSDLSKNEIQISGMMPETLTATVMLNYEIEGETYNLISIPTQFAYNSSHGKCDLRAIYYDEEDGKWYLDSQVLGLIQDDGSIILVNWMVLLITEGEYEGYNLIPIYMPYSTFTPVGEAEDVVATPAEPSFLNVFDYDATEGYGSFVFNIPTTDVDGKYMVKDKLFYSVWKEEGGVQEIYTFTPTLYTKLTESMTEIPYTFTDNWDFQNKNGGKMVFINEDFTSKWTNFGIQSIYYGGGECKKSAVVWYKTDGISTMKAEKTEGVIYSIDGRRLNKVPTSGLYIQNGKKYVVK